MLRMYLKVRLKKRTKALGGLPVDSLVFPFDYSHVLSFPWYWRH